MTKIDFKIKDIQRATSMQDFYKRVGLLSQLSEENPIDIDKIWMNKKQNEQLKGNIVKNLKKLKEYKDFTEHYIECAVGWDWLNWSPVSDDSIPKYEIWILTDDELVEFKEKLMSEHPEDEYFDDSQAPTITIE